MRTVGTDSDWLIADTGAVRVRVRVRVWVRQVIKSRKAN